MPCARAGKRERGVRDGGLKKKLETPNRGVRLANSLCRFSCGCLHPARGPANHAPHSVGQLAALSPVQPPQAAPLHAMATLAPPAPPAAAPLPHPPPSAGSPTHRHRAHPAAAPLPGSEGSRHRGGGAVGGVAAAAVAACTPRRRPCIPVPPGRPAGGWWGGGRVVGAGHVNQGEENGGDLVGGERGLVGGVEVSKHTHLTHRPSPSPGAPVPPSPPPSLTPWPQALPPKWRRWAGRPRGGPPWMRMGPPSPPPPFDPPWKPRPPSPPTSRGPCPWMTPPSRCASRWWGGGRVMAPPRCRARRRGWWSARSSAEAAGRPGLHLRPAR